MKAIVISQPGGPDVLKLEERPAPLPKPQEVLVRVKAAGVNRADIAGRKGIYPAPPGVPADIPGLEIAGLVESCGSEVTRWKRGDAVCALLAGGGYAEHAVVDTGHCLPVPAGMSFTDAAALPEVIFTVWSNVFQRGQLKSGERFLVHGGSSGIGMAAIQLARAFHAVALTTAGSDEKCQACLTMGADRAINYRSEDFEQALKEPGVDVILDMIGGDYLPKNLRILRPEGRLIFINSMKGATPPLDIPLIMSHRLVVTGSMLRNRESQFKSSLARAVEDNVWPLIAGGKFKPNVFKIIPLSDAAEAHRLMESSTHIGKIVLAV